MEILIFWSEKTNLLISVSCNSGKSLMKIHQAGISWKQHNARTQCTRTDGVKRHASNRVSDGMSTRSSKRVYLSLSLSCEIQSLNRRMRYPVWTHCCKWPNYDFWLGFIATVYIISHSTTRATAPPTICFRRDDTVTPVLHMLKPQISQLNILRRTATSVNCRKRTKTNGQAILWNFVISSCVALCGRCCT